MRAKGPSDNESAIHGVGRLGMGATGHLVQFYEDDSFLVQTVVYFIGDALRAGEGAVVIATAEHRAQIAAGLRASGIDVDQAMQTWRYAALDASETLDKIMADGQLDESRFVDVVGGIVGRTSACNAKRRIRAFGEMVALLWAAGRPEAAIALEELWNRLAQRLSFSLLCGYPIRGFPTEHSAAFRAVCAAHAQVIPAESYTALTSADERLRGIARLQQQASALNAEIAQRKASEQTLAERNNMLHALVDASPLPIVVIAPDTAVRLWNPAAERMFGWAEHEVLGKALPIVPTEMSTEWAAVRAAALRGESLLAAETQRLRRDGTEIAVRMSAAPLLSSDGAVREIVLLFEDVSERDRVEESRQKTLRELQTFYEVTQVLSAELDLQRLIQALTDAATELSGAETGAFFYNVADGQNDQGLLYALSGSERRGVSERVDLLDSRALFAATFAERHVVRIDDLRAHTRRDEPPVFAPDSAVRSYLAVPVVGRAGEVFGGLFLGHSAPSVFSPDAARVVGGLAAHASVAIENARLYEAERRARSEAEASNRAKDEFLAMLGHELRNPLSAVRNAIVSARLEPALCDRALEIAQRQADYLTRLVDDLLDVARITQGRIPLHREPVSFAGIVERAVETTRQLIEERAHAITLSLPRGDVRIDADAIRLEQVFVNLITNAAKYTPPGGHIELIGRVVGTDAELVVRDTGIGIRAEVLPRIFDLFVQGDRELDRAQGGLGVGLTVARRLVELHGGRITAASSGGGKGAEFTVSIPTVTTNDRPPDRPGEVSATHARSRILMVEDNRDAAESLMMILEFFGHHVRIAYDGLAAIAAAQAIVPDVMLIDIGLPGIDGYEVAARVRQDPKLKDVVLVALTGYGGNEDKQRAMQAGFDHHLVKPVDVSVLKTLVAGIGEAAAEPGPARSPAPTLH